MFTEETRREAKSLLDLCDGDLQEVFMRYCELSDIEILQVLITEGFIEHEEIEEIDFE